MPVLDTPSWASERLTKHTMKKRHDNSIAHGYYRAIAHIIHSQRNAISYIQKRKTKLTTTSYIPL